MLISELKKAIQNAANDAVVRRAGFEKGKEQEARECFTISDDPVTGGFRITLKSGYRSDDPRLSNLLTLIQRSNPSFACKADGSGYLLSKDDAEKFYNSRKSSDQFNFGGSDINNNQRNLEKAFSDAMELAAVKMGQAGTVTVRAEAVGPLTVIFSDAKLAVQVDKKFPGFINKDANRPTVYSLPVAKAGQFCQAVREQPFRDYLEQLGKAVKADTWDTKGWSLGSSKVPENIQALRNILSAYDGSNSKACFDQVSKIMDKANSGNAISAVFRDKEVDTFYRAQQKAIGQIERSQEVTAMPSGPVSTRTFGNS